MAYPGTYKAAINLIDESDKRKKIVDLGCGKGFVVKRLRKIGFRNISYCDVQDKFDKKVKVMDFNKGISYQSNSFDIAIATEVIEHLENKYLFFREIKRILKPNGILIFSSPNIRNVPNRIMYLLTGKFIEFNKNIMPEHINPFFLWEIPDFFKIEKIAYNRGFIPLIRIPFLSNFLFGQTVVIKCNVKKD